MIRSALVFTKNTLDQYLKNRFKLLENITILNHLVNQDGAAPLKNQNKMVLSLINLEEETNRQFTGQYQMQGERYLQVNPSFRFTVDLLFTASFEDYEESLKFLTATISYFQGNRSLTVTNHPDIPKGIQKLDFDIESLNYSQTHNLWTAMGAKYQPSVIYKVRLLSIQADLVQEAGSLIQGVSTSTKV